MNFFLCFNKVTKHFANDLNITNAFEIIELFFYSLRRTTNIWLHVSRNPFKVKYFFVFYTNRMHASGLLTSYYRLLSEPIWSHRRYHLPHSRWHPWKKTVSWNYFFIFYCWKVARWFKAKYVIQRKQFLCQVLILCNHDKCKLESEGQKNA